MINLTPIFDQTPQSKVMGVRNGLSNSTVDVIWKGLVSNLQILHHQRVSLLQMQIDLDVMVHFPGGGGGDSRTGPHFQQPSTRAS